jgi:hypothetical protein
VPTIYIHCDSESIIERPQSSMYKWKFKHIHYRHNIVKYFLSNRIASINYVKSKKNIMDSLTEGLSREFVYNSLIQMRLKPLKMKEYNDGNHT